MKGTVSDEDIF